MACLTSGQTHNVPLSITATSTGDAYHLHSHYSTSQVSDSNRALGKWGASELRNRRRRSVKCPLMVDSSVPYCTVEKVVMCSEAPAAEQKQEGEGMYNP